MRLTCASEDAISWADFIRNLAAWPRNSSVFLEQLKCYPNFHIIGSIEISVDLIMRLQLALNVKDLDAAIEFYAKVFGAKVNKRKPGYANFAIDQPPLKLVLFEAPATENRINHLGVEVFDDADVDAAAQRISAGGLVPELQDETTCCFAKQNKAIVYDPDGTMWEWYRLIEDSDSFFAASEEPSRQTGATSASDTQEGESGSCCEGTNTCCAA